MNMLEAEIKDTVTMSDGNVYVVTSKIVYEGKTYFCLTNADLENMLFGFEHDGDFIELQDKELTRKLLPLFFEETKKHIPEFEAFDIPNDEAA